MQTHQRSYGATLRGIPLSWSKGVHGHWFGVSVLPVLYQPHAVPIPRKAHYCVIEETLATSMNTAFMHPHTHTHTHTRIYTHTHVYTYMHIQFVNCSSWESFLQPKVYCVGDSRGFQHLWPCMETVQSFHTTHLKHIKSVLITELDMTNENI